MHGPIPVENFRPDRRRTLMSFPTVRTGIRLLVAGVFCAGFGMGAQLDQDADVRSCNQDASEERRRIAKITRSSVWKGQQVLELNQRKQS